LIFLAVACYVGVSLYNAFVNTYETTPAVSYSIEETLSAEGYIVRTETILEEISATVLPIVGEGEKVAAGQAIAVEYITTDALEAASEIRALRMKISQLESYRGNNDRAGFDAVLELSSAVNHNDLRRLDEITLIVEAGVFSVENDLSSLQSRLEELEGRNLGTRIIIAQLSGTFSHVVDGFEHIFPDMLYEMSPDELTAAFISPFGTSGTGKLITEFNWYYAALMNYDDASQLSAGQRKNVQFFGAYNAEFEMLVEQISKREDDMCVVLFSSDRGIHEVAPQRALRADIVSNVVTGIRVPKRAIHLDENNKTFVFLQTSGFAEAVEVEILRETGDSYLVRDGAETGSPLRVDSIIIVKANNLYHGKVIA